MTEPTPALPMAPAPAPALSYATPPAPPPSAQAAVMLCLPGTICWLSLGWIILTQLAPSFVRRSGITLMQLFGPGYLQLLLICWAVAVVAAVISLALYARRRPKPWYVRLNLVINVAGLLFTAGVFVVIAVVNLGG